MTANGAIKPLEKRGRRSGGAYAQAKGQRVLEGARRVTCETNGIAACGVAALRDQAAETTVALLTSGADGSGRSKTRSKLQCSNNTR